MTYFYLWFARQRILKLLSIVAFSACGLTGHAAITCSIAPPPAVNFAYVTGTNNTSPANVQQGSVSVTCTRTSSGDTTSLSLAVSDGQNKSGSSNNVLFVSGGNNYRISYDFYKDSACNTSWAANSSGRINATILNTTLNVPVTSTFPYWACKPTAQSLSSYPTGQYTDLVGLTLYAGGSNVASSSISVNLYAPAVCSISNGPGNLNFAYPAFSQNAVFAGTSFKANCSNFLPYTMTLNPVSGVVGGLHYTLGLSLNAAGTASMPRA